MLSTPNFLQRKRGIFLAAERCRADQVFATTAFRAGVFFVLGELETDFAFLEL
jgi:hypothetical protein